MKVTKNLFLSVLAALCSTSVFAQGTLKDAVTEGKISGNIRSYYFTRDFENREDEAAFSLGGALRAESGSIGFMKVGLGYYTAQDMGTNPDDPAKVNGRLGSDLEVLGEAFVKFTALDSDLTVGRQLINTPWANAGDAFMIPFTFQATSFINKSIEGLTFEIDYLSEIKNRNSEEFVNVGHWTSKRYGVAPSTSTSGTMNMGAKYSTKSITLEAWLTRVSEFFDTGYVNGNYNFNVGGSITPFVGVQYAQQKDSGDSLLGEVDSTLYGIQAGSGFGKFKATLGFNSVAEQTSAFKNGAFLAPYSYATSPLFTNNMLETFENVDSGDAGKITFNYSPFSSLAMKLSYADFNFDNVVDRNATDVDITYSFDGYWKGLSFRWRVEVVDSDSDAVSQTNHRFMLQYAF